MKKSEEVCLHDSWQAMTSKTCEKIFISALPPDLNIAREKKEHF